MALWSRGKLQQRRISTWFGTWMDRDWSKRYLVGIEDPFDDTDNTARCIGTSDRNSNTAGYIGLVFSITATYMTASCSGNSERTSSIGSSSGGGRSCGGRRSSSSGGASSSGADAVPVDMFKLRMIYSWLFGPKGVLCLGPQAAYGLLGLPYEHYQMLQREWAMLYQHLRGREGGQHWLPVECYRGLLGMVQGPQEVPLNLREWKSMMDQQRRQQLQEQAQQRLAQRAAQQAAQQEQQGNGEAAAAAGGGGGEEGNGMGSCAPASVTKAGADLGSSTTALRSELQQQQDQQSLGLLGSLERKPIPQQQQQHALAAVHQALAGLLPSQQPQQQQQQPVAAVQQALAGPRSQVQQQQQQLTQNLYYNHQQQQQPSQGQLLGQQLLQGLKRGKAVSQQQQLEVQDNDAFWLQKSLEQMQLESRQAAQQHM